MAGINVFIPQVATDFANASGVFASGIAQLQLDFLNSSGIFIKDGRNVGSGVEIFFQKDEIDQVLEFRSLVAGSGINITTSGNTIVFNSQTFDDIALIISDLNDLRTDFTNSSGIFQAGADCAAQVKLDFANSSGVFTANISFNASEILRVETNFLNSSGIFQTGADCAAQVKTDFNNSSGVFRSDINQNTSDISDLRDDFTNSSGIFQTGADCAAQVKTDFGNSSGVFRNDIDEIRTNFDNSSGVWVEDGENLGAGSGVFKQKDTERNLEFRTLVAGPGIVINQSTTELQIASPTAGEATTASNVGVGSGESFAQEVGNDLQFRRLLAGSGMFISTSGNTIRIDSTLEDDFQLVRTDVDNLRTDFDNSSGVFRNDIDEIRLDFDNASGVWVKDGENLGTGSGVFVTKDAEQNLEFRTIIAGNGIGINQTAATLEFFVVPGAESTSAKNVGIGSGEVFAQEVGNELQFRRILAGSGIIISTSGNTVRVDSALEDDVQLNRTDINQLRTDFDNSSGVFQAGTDTANQVRTDFDNSSGVWVENGENLGAGSGVFKQKDAERNLEFRTLVAGPGIVINQSATELQIAAPAEAEATTASNVGIGSGEVFAQEIGNDLQFRRLLAGSGIFISTSGNTVRVDNTLEDDLFILEAEHDQLRLDFDNSSGVFQAGTNTANQVRTDFDNASGIWVKDGENLGGAEEVFIQKDAEVNLEFRTLIGSSGVIVSTSGNTIRFDNTLVDDFGIIDGRVDQLRLDFDNASGIWVKDGENLGTGSGVFKQKDAEENLEFRTLVPGPGIAINQSAAELEIFSTVAAEATTASNVGIGSGDVFAQEVGNDLQFRRLLAGSGIFITTSGNTVRIDSTLEDDVSINKTDIANLRTDFDNSSGVFVKNGENVGTGSGVFLQKDADQNLEFKTLIPSSGIMINDLGNELEISADVGDIVINNEFNTAVSGIVSNLFLSVLPLHADDDDVTHETINGLPVARYRQNFDIFSQWNLRATQGAISGITLEITFFPQNTLANKTIEFKTTVLQLPSGVDTTSLTSSETSTSLTRDWTANELNIEEIFVPATIPELQNFSVRFQRLGTLASDDYNARVFVVSYAIKYNSA